MAKTPTKIDPTTRLDFLAAMAMDQRLNAGVVRIGIILLWHRNGQTGLICPSHQTLAREAACSVPTVKRSIRELVDNDWFAIRHRGRDGSGKKKTNQYEPNWNRLWGSSMAEMGVTSNPGEGSPVIPDGGHQRPIELSEDNSVKKNSVNVTQCLPENEARAAATADASAAADDWVSQAYQDDQEEADEFRQEIEGLSPHDCGEQGKNHFQAASKPPVKCPPDEGIMAPTAELRKRAVVWDYGQGEWPEEWGARPDSDGFWVPGFLEHLFREDVPKPEPKVPEVPQGEPVAADSFEF